MSRFYGLGQHVMKIDVEENLDSDNELAIDVNCDCQPTVWLSLDEIRLLRDRFTVLLGESE